MINAALVSGIRWTTLAQIRKITLSMLIVNIIMRVIFFVNMYASLFALNRRSCLKDWPINCWCNNSSHSQIYIEFNISLAVVKYCYKFNMKKIILFTVLHARNYVRTRNRILIEKGNRRHHNIRARTRLVANIPSGIGFFPGYTPSWFTNRTYSTYHETEFAASASA